MTSLEEETSMEEIAYKGYFTNYGYMGHIGNGEYRMFATESDYSDWIKDRDE